MECKQHYNSRSDGRRKQLQGVRVESAIRSDGGISLVLISVLIVVHRVWSTSASVIVLCVIAGLRSVYSSPKTT